MVRRYRGPARFALYITRSASRSISSAARSSSWCTSASPTLARIGVVVLQPCHLRPPLLAVASSTSRRVAPSVLRGQHLLGLLQLNMSNACGATAGKRAAARDLRYTISKIRHICEICALPRKSTTLSCDTTLSAIDGNVTKILRRRRSSSSSVAACPPISGAGYAASNCNPETRCARSGSSPRSAGCPNCAIDSAG